MNKLRIAIIIGVVLVSCRTKIKNENYNTQLSSFILHKKELIDSITSIFKINDTTNYIFKLTVSRRDKFVRITIYELRKQLSNQDSPSTYFTYFNNTFLCYDGSELLFNKRFDDTLMNRVNRNLKSFSGDVLYHSDVFQFDVFDNMLVRVNLPAINPYDLNEENKVDKILFSPKQ